MIRQRPEHITAATVAKEVGVHPRTIHRWESGQSEPSISQWMTYVLACDVQHQLAFHIEMHAACYRWDEKHPDELDE